MATSLLAAAASGVLGYIAAVQSLIDVGQNIIDMFDPDAQADHLSGTTPARRAVRRATSAGVGGRSRRAGQRLGIAQVHQAGDELGAGIVEADGGFRSRLLTPTIISEQPCPLRYCYAAA